MDAERFNETGISHGYIAVSLVEGDGLLNL
jgi:hypothetical protein